MSIPEKDIQAIFKCFDEERFQDAKDLLEEAADKDVNNHHIYYFKAICCIQMNKLDEALINLGEVAYLNPDYVPSMHALAYIFLRKGDFESAMDKWLAIKTIAPKDPLINSILNKIKTKQIQKDPLNRYNILDFIQVDSKELKKGLAFAVEDNTSPPKKISTAATNSTEEHKALPHKQLKKTQITHQLNFFSIGIIVFFVLSLFFSLILIYNVYTAKTNGKRIYQDFLELNQEPTFFSFKEEEIQQKRSEILKLLKTKNYNQTVVALNELYYSNSSVELKKELKNWKQSMEQPKNIKQAGEVIAWSQIAGNPFLYQGIFLQKQGIVSNFLKRPQYITFDLDIKPNIKISNIYFFDKSSEDLPFDNKDELKVFGFVRLDENKKPFIENTNVQLLKTSTLS